MKWLTFIHQDQDMTYVIALDGSKMRELGWTPAKSVRDRIATGY